MALKKPRLFDFSPFQTCTGRGKDVTKGLHTLLNEDEINKLHKRFDEKEHKRLNRDELRSALVEDASINYPDDLYELEFKRINFSCNGYATWDEFISHLINLSEQALVSYDYRTLKLPISEEPKMMRSHHRYPIRRITFYPQVQPDRTTSWNNGSILTCSHDGVMNYWSLDMTVERTNQSKCPLLNFLPTFVLDVVVLADVNVICTSSTERDLRFYDTSGRKFDLRVMITSLEYAVCCMNYTFGLDPEKESVLVLGDMSGGVRILFIDTINRGPFKSEPSMPLLHVSWDQVVKGHVKTIRVLQLQNIHNDNVRQVYYYSSLNSIVSCSQNPQRGLLMSEAVENKKSRWFKSLAGVWCFAVEPTVHLIASGGPDFLIRLWNVFVLKSPISVFYGHHTGVVSMVFQDEGTLLYSLAADKCIKVWNVRVQNCIQTYLGLPSTLGERNDMITMYNPESRQWLIGNAMIAILPLNPKDSVDHTEGNTHNSAVSVVLYNVLFKKVVTCGLDSYIIVWDPFDGRRMLAIENAHTRMVHGETFAVEITTGTFDPGYHRLLTGAHDGTLKIWNFHTGTCLRNMRIDPLCEVQTVIWIKERILAMGWNKRVTEFSDTNVVDTESKHWDLRHTEDISSASVLINEALVTSSYTGELLMWRLETGQPYMMFNVSNPTARLKIVYNIAKKPNEEAKEQERSSLVRRSTTRRSTRRSGNASVACSTSEEVPVPQLSIANLSTVSKMISKALGKSKDAGRDKQFNLRKIAVHCMLFLSARESKPKVGTLLVALENGVIQVWNHNRGGGFLMSFSCIHSSGDYALSMATDENNEFLFTGSAVGYIKTWLLVNYCVSPEDKVHVSMSEYRLRFPFLWRSKILGRVERMMRYQPEPRILNSYKGHFMPITSLVYINDSEILISGSADYTVRLWSLSGQYLQTLGTFKPWKFIDPQPIRPIRNNFEFEIPADIRRAGSSTTLRVMNAGNYRLSETPLIGQNRNVHVKIDRHKIYGRRLEDPILGSHLTLPFREITPKDVKLDLSFPYIPVYDHLKMPPLEPLKRPDIPKVILNTEKT